MARSAALLRGARSVRRMTALACLLTSACVPGLAGRPGAGPLSPNHSDDDAPTGVLRQRWRVEVHPTEANYRPEEFASAGVLDSVVLGRTVFIGSHAGALVALGAVDGKRLWRSELGSVSTRPVSDGRRLFIGTDEGTLFAVDPATGKVTWKYVTRAAILHPPVLLGDLVVFSNDDDKVFALEADSGKKKWQTAREKPEEFTVRGHAGLSTNGKNVFAGFSDGSLVAYEGTTGAVVWTRSLAGGATQFVDVDTTPVVTGDLLVAASVAGGVVAMDPADGAELWRLDVPGAGGVAVAQGTVYFTAAEEGVYAVTRHGQILWRQGLAGAGDPSAPVVAGDILFFSTADAGLFVVNRETGRLLQSFDPGSGVSSDPAVVDDTLYVMSNGGVLYAFDADLYPR